MLKTHLLSAVCSAALLAAVPAVAQSQSNGMNSGSMSGGQGQTTDTGASHPRPMHHMNRSGQTATSQDAEVDRLNEQSLQAAQQGSTFSAGSGSTGMSSGAGGSGSAK